MALATHFFDSRLVLRTYGTAENMVTLAKKFQMEPVEWLFRDADCEKAALQEALFAFGDDLLTFRLLGSDHWELVDAQGSGRLTGEFGRSGKSFPANASVLLSVVILRWAMRFPDDVILCFPDGLRLRHYDVSAENVAMRHRNTDFAAVEAIVLKAGVGRIADLSKHCKKTYPQNLFIT